ncbi:helix-turn-helix transcriptional regulator [Acinetobacter boissieri]|uniref:Transcriptional regulator, AlpA family n=1 Tax=Acinetobacter boissieri TaxID=1219383 RepID=A0A1G6K3T3_9GAMM|nr:AlpA family transcriptional regulator [Acinetobacter boissieri]SDC25689.1 transcriptional regulator, AlpA family [Acinetobacter boissieri]
MNLSKEQQQENRRLIRCKEVQNKTGLAPSSIYAMMKKGEFPLCLSLSERRVAWLESDIDDWINERIAKHKASTATVAV